MSSTWRFISSGVGGDEFQRTARNSHGWMATNRLRSMNVISSTTYHTTRHDTHDTHATHDTEREM
jgi:hypothetical protein